jgi:hypothetical protein
MSSSPKRSRCGSPVLFPLFLSLSLILLCGGSFAQSPIIKNIQSAPPQRGITNKDMQDICAAALSLLFDRPASVIMAEGPGEGMMYLSFPQTPRQYKCRITGKEVLWAATDEPWPTGDSAGQVGFQLNQNDILITVRMPDGSEKESRLPREQKKPRP